MFDRSRCCYCVGVWHQRRISPSSVARQAPGDGDNTRHRSDVSNVIIIIQIYRSQASRPSKPLDTHKKTVIKIRADRLRMLYLFSLSLFLAYYFYVSATAPFCWMVSVRGGGFWPWHSIHQMLYRAEANKKETDRQRSPALWPWFPVGSVEILMVPVTRVGRRGQSIEEEEEEEGYRRPFIRPFFAAMKRWFDWARDLRAARVKRMKRNTDEVCRLKPRWIVNI